MKCKTCGMEDGNHDRACWQQQLHEQKMRIIMKMVEIKRKHPGEDPSDKLVRSTIEQVQDIVLGA